MPQDRAWRLKIIAAFAIVYVVWGSTYLAIRVGVATLPPALFAGARFLAAGGAARGVCAFRRPAFSTHAP